MIFFLNTLTEEFRPEYSIINDRKCKKVRIDKRNFSGNRLLQRIYRENEKSENSPMKSEFSHQ